MASGGRKERLTCAETVLFRFAIRERKPAVFVLKNRYAVGMRVHLRFLVCTVIYSELAHLLIFELNLVMFRGHCSERCGIRILRERRLSLHKGVRAPTCRPILAITSHLRFGYSDLFHEDDWLRIADADEA